MSMKYEKMGLEAQKKTLRAPTRRFHIGRVLKAKQRTWVQGSGRTPEIHVKCLIQKSPNLVIFLRTKFPKIYPHMGSGIGFS
jgi:hypothetical protein